MWERTGYAILPPELNIILKQFEDDYGYVHYSEFLEFVKKRKQNGGPCATHGRLVCAECITYGGIGESLSSSVIGRLYQQNKSTIREWKCCGYRPLRKRSRICSHCGLHSSMHAILPKQEISRACVSTPKHHYYTIKECTDESLHMILNQKRNPDSIVKALRNPVPIKDAFIIGKISHKNVKKEI